MSVHPPSGPTLLPALASIFGIDRDILALTIREPKDDLLTVSVEFPVTRGEVEQIKAVVRMYYIQPAMTVGKPTA